MQTLWNNSSRLMLILLFAGCGTGSTQNPGEEPFVQPGDRIVFFGDSITRAGASPGGYVSLLAEALDAQFPGYGIEVIGAGIGGNRVPDLLARVDQDVLAQDPTIVVIYIGINDVWHWRNDRGTPKEAYEAGLRTLAGRLEAAGTDIVICTPSVIGERHDGTNPMDTMLDEYAGISRTVAADHGLRVCDLRADFLEYLKLHNDQNEEQGILTTDGVHLNESGNRFVAERILRTLGA